MSLVNDMLRDLDQRRQESSPTKIGVERLVPVSSSDYPSNGNRSLFSFVLTIAITLAAIMGVIYFWQSMPSSTTQPILVAPTITPAPVASIGPSVAQRELEEIALRMQQLEAQNRALIEAQSTIAAQATPAPPMLEEEQIEPEIETVAATVEVVQPAAVAPVAVDSVQVVEPEIAQSSEAQPSSQIAAELESPPAPEPEINSAPIRSPRSLSFAERDLLQVQEAMRLAGRDQSSLAMQQLQEFVSANPNAHNSREAMIKLALQLGEMALAQQQLQEGFELEAGRTAYRKLEARILLSTGQAEQAMQLLSTQVPTIAEDVEFHDILATAYLSVQNFEKAAQSYEQLVQQNRGEGRWWYGLASAWDSLGRTRDAGLAYQQALKLPNLSMALRQLSQQRVVEMGL